MFRLNAVIYSLAENKRLDTAKYRDTTLEKMLKIGIEYVSALVLYEYQRVNGIIHIVTHVSSCEMALKNLCTLCRKLRNYTIFLE